MNPSICTVVIPAYNAARHLEETVSSVLSSSGVSIELIIVDDGSTDSTPAILSLMASSNRGITVITTENAGVSSARNRGLSLVSSPFICFLDADDRVTPNALATLCLALESNPEAVAVYGGVQYIDERSRRLSLSKRKFFKKPEVTVTVASIMQRNFTDTPGAILFRTAAIKLAGGFDATLLYAEDWEIYIRVARLGPFVYCGEKVIDYRLHASSAMSNKGLTHHDFEPALSKVFDKPAELYGMSAKTLKMYEYKMRVRIQEVIILKSKGLRTQWCNVRKIVSILFNSNREPVLIKATLKGIFSAMIRVF